MILRRIKYFLAGIVTYHPYIWYAAWQIVPRLKFLLPHEKSYYAFRHLAVPSEGLFLDVGANNGLSALGFRRLIPSYRILSIEANCYHEPALKKLKQKLDKFDYVITAAGDKNSQFTMYTGMYKRIALHTGASLNIEYLKKGLEHVFPKGVVKKITYVEQLVKVIRLDDLNVAPAIIKIDVEGFDYEALVGLRETIAGHRPPILIEYSPPLPDKLEPFCSELSYSIFVYDNQADRFSRFDRERVLQMHLDGGSPVNLFLIPSERVGALPMALF